MVDLSGGYGGYIADGSRTYSLGPLSTQMRDTHRFILDLHESIETQLKPGAIPSEVYSNIQYRLARPSFVPHFMGENQVKFNAHGVGLELDEIPVIAPEFGSPLEANVVVALESKVFYPGLGRVGVENTYLITGTGCERLTTSPQEIFER